LRPVAASGECSVIGPGSGPPYPYRLPVIAYTRSLVFAAAIIAAESGGHFVSHCVYAGLAQL
jgi:hypothetical protein